MNEITSFAALGLTESLLNTLQNINFSIPTAIQIRAIPAMLTGQDVIGQAQTGTGKTAAFALPIIQNINYNSLSTQALILAPTRELAIQIADQLSVLGAFQKSLTIALLCGGQDYRSQLRKLRSGAHIVVGTPGRILDHIDRETLNLTQLKTLVLDEADEMLRMGFIEDVESILAKTPDNKQMALFSATLPPRIRQIANEYLHNPISIEIHSATATVKSTAQKFIFVDNAIKQGALLRLLAAEDYQGVIIFVRTKISSEEVANKLHEYGYSALALHGDLGQPVREKIIQQFRNGIIDILVATDVAARGLDVERITHVINYDIPQDCETYIHRIGRTGRAGRTGTSILLITPKQSYFLHTLERHTKEKIEKITIPHDELIAQIQQQKLFKAIIDRFNHEHFPAYQKLCKTFLEQHPKQSPVDLAAALALLHHKDKLCQQNFPSMKIRELSPKTAKRNDHKNDHRKVNQGHSGKQYNTERVLYRLEVGHKHGVKPGNIVGAIANEGGISSRLITGLKIHAEHSTVYLPSVPKDVFKHLQKAWVCGRQLKLASVANGDE